MKGLAFYGEGAHHGLADLDAFLVGALVEDASDREACFGCGGGDQFDHGHAAFEWTTPPVLRDVAEQPMFDLVPLRCSWRIMMDAQRHAGLVGELLQFHFP